MQLSTYYNLSDIVRKPVYAYVNNKGADQPAHTCNLTIIIFGVHCLNCIIPILAESCEQDILGLIRLQNPKDRFSREVDLKVNYLTWKLHPLTHPTSL